MKRIYVSKEIVANGVPIKVRQVLGKGDSDIRERMKRVASTAQGWLTQVMPEVRSNMAPGVASAFNACFRKAPDPASVSTVRSMLSTVQSSLGKAHGVKVREDDDAYGYVTRSYAGRIHLINGMINYDADGDAIARRGEIHLDTGTVRNNMTMATITYIHEAMHRFCNARDHGDQGYFESDGSDYEAPGLTWQQALQNADSYAYFVYKTLESKFRSVVVT